jgi:glycosyltransferase involved in cell wall biosynthesis
MRVLVYTSLYPNNVWPNHGVFVKERMTHVARIPGVDLRVVSPVPYYPPVPFGWRRAYRNVARHETRDGIPVDHPRYGMLPKVSSGLHGELLFRSTLPAVARLKQEFPFDVIDAHYIYPDAYAATKIGKALGVPVVASARGSDVNLLGRMASLRPLVRSALERSRQVIAVSKALGDAIVDLEIPARKVTVIPNGVDAAKFHAMSSGDARARLGLPSGPVLVSVGNLVTNKGFDRLLRALRIASSGPGEPLRPALVIIGSGPEEGRLRRLVETLDLAQQVRFAGAIPHDDLVRWYAAADCFCLATEREGWPNAVLESLACGTPVVATAVGGVPEIVRSDGVGILVGSTDEAFARGIRAALERRWDRAEIARFGASHSWDAAAKAVVAIFERALEPEVREARVAS